MSRLSQKLSFTGWWIKQVFLSSLIIGILFFIVFNFYILSSVISLQKFFYVFLVVSVLTDGVFVLIHFPRRAHKHSKLSFDPTKLTVVIACYNGEDIIAETIEQAKQHVPANQIIVVSDASSDHTAEVARAAGAKVIVNDRNVNKAFSITRAVHHVRTPYTLVLDDDTLIGKTFIPTSLLDDGYTAVAFNVMPKAEGTIVNHMQRYEYRKSMELGKNLRSRVGAVGNVSGAIGLFRTKDLIKQTRLHSGQFGGEDEQRTVLAHIYGEGNGIVYSSSLVITKAPANWQQLLKQRSFRWNLSLPELFVLYVKILLSPNHHYLLKSEKAYQLYIYLTDPLRMLFFWVLLTRPANILISYAFYFGLSVLIWLRTKCKDPWWVVVLYPPYSLLLSVCRFVASFYWLKIKFQYLFKDRFHRFVTQRRLVWEYASIIVLISVFWVAAIYHFNNDMQFLNKLRNSRLEDNSQQFSYDSSTSLTTPYQVGDSITLAISPSDNMLTVAHRSVDIVLAETPLITIPANQRSTADQFLANKLQQNHVSLTGSTVTISRNLIIETLTDYNSGK